jgi:threonine dehydratase
LLEGADGSFECFCVVITVPELQAAAIRAAHAAIDPVFTNSPQYVHDGLSRRLGVPVIVKVETVNPIRSFKGRGTWIVVHGLAGEGRIGRKRPVACVSAGNFGQGIAYAARSLGIPSVVFTSRNANKGKVERMRALGADVIAAGETFDDARDASEDYARQNQVELVVDGEDQRIACGAATLALEVTDAAASGHLPQPTLPECRVIGVQAEAAAAMARSFEAGRPIDTETADTFADGIATRVAIPNAVTLMAGRVDEMRLVSEAALREAQSVLTEELGITVEGAAAATWAGALAGPRPAGPVLLVVTGSNV